MVILGNIRQAGVDAEGNINCPWAKTTAARPMIPIAFRSLALCTQRDLYAGN